MSGLPFTAEQFFGVFARYNEAVWPAQVGSVFLALVVVYSILRPSAGAGGAASVILWAFWTQMGAVYHMMFFTAINPLAYAFALLSIAGGVTFLWWGAYRKQIRFERARGWRASAGWALIVYALAVYPALSWLLGHHYPAAPTFGLPCPTTIFTIGVLAFMARPYPWQVLVAPILWAAIGGSAALLLEVPEDLALWVAGAVSLVLAMRSREARNG
jgi:integral membrane sensor domain MASE1